MDRLTDVESGVIRLKDVNYIIAMVDRLRKYEDTGYTPQEIKEMNETIDRLTNIADHADNDRRQAVGEMEKWKAKYEVTSSVIAKLRDWLKSEGTDMERFLDFFLKDPVADKLQELLDRENERFKG